MAATTTTSQQHRYQDYAGLPDIAQPIISTANNKAQAPLRGARRDYLTLDNQNSSRQTMTTAGSSSRGMSDNGRFDRHVGVLDNNCYDSNYRCPQDERERLRRAEENAAFVTMLEAESYMLQGAQVPMDRPPSGAGSGAYDDLPAFSRPSNSSGYREGGGGGGGRASYASRGNNMNSYSSGRSGGWSRPYERYSHQHQHQQSSHQQHYHPHDLYSPYHHQQQNEDDDDDQLLDVRRRNPIPHELPIPTTGSRGRGFQPTPDPLLEGRPQEYNLNMNVDDIRIENHGEDRRHPEHHHAFNLQSLSHSLPPGQAPSIRRHTVNSRGEDFQPPPNPMSLVEAIYNLEMEQNGQRPQHPLPPHHTQRQPMPDDYDGVVAAGDRNPLCHHPSPHHSLQHDDNRHYPPPPQEIGVANSYYPHVPQQQHDPQEPLRAAYHQTPQRLLAPVDFVEFPVGWDGREIEPTLDDELLDREEDEYYRRRAVHRLQQQQQHPSSMRSIQSQSFHTQSLHAQSLASSRASHNPGSGACVRRMHSNVSREDSFGGRPAGVHQSDMCSQNVAFLGRRAPIQMIEISPGVSMPFRGSEETWEAIALNRIVRTECLGCSIQLYCVVDAELVVCPDCQTMSPAHKTEDLKANRIGLGLGFKEEQLVKWRHAGPY